MPTDPMALANALDPSLYPQQLQAQQQQALAQLLMQQGLAPMGGTESVGGVAIRRSPMEGAAKLAALLSGQSMQGQANQSAGALMAQQAAAMRGAFFPPTSPQGQASPQALGAALGGQQAPQQPQGGGMTIPGMGPGQAMTSYMTAPDKYMESFNKQFDPTDMQKMLRAAGIDPTSPLGQQIAQTAVAKANNMPLEEVKAGNTALDPITKQPRFYAPRVPEGAIPAFGGPGGTVSSIGMLPGATDAITASEAAQGAGKAQNEMVSYENPDGSKTNMTRAQAVALTNAPPKFDVKPGTEAAFRTSLVKQGDQAALAAFDQQYGKAPGFRTGQTTAAAAAAAKAGALPQEDLDKRFSELKVANAQAETTNSYLQNIKDLAAKAATGQFADKQALLNSLLSQLPGVNERATDAVTATNLIDKYSKQIVARLGQGSLGTDAARDLLQAAYPSKYMSKEAIADASDNLIGANQMIQAKARLLSPHGNARDPVAYQEKEQVFDQNADPRIWQYANIQDPAKRKLFLQNILKSDPRFLEKAQRLHEIGAL